MAQLDSHATVTETMSFLQKVYAWMFLGLSISGLTAFIVAQNPVFYQAIIFNNVLFYSLLISELAIVLSISAFIRKLSALSATLIFILYCFITGLTLSLIFLLFTLDSIVMVFFIAAGMFGVMSVYGFLTKRDLTDAGRLLTMGLIGIILATVVNLFLQNSVVDYIVSISGVVVFTGLTAYDVQKIKETNIIGNEGTPEDHKESIMGALRLYLDFINLFFDLLKLFGKRR